MQRLIANHDMPLDEEVRELRVRLARLNAEVDILACQIEKAKGTSA
jgi:hypothetical protein